jgi:hypothetical protein
MGQQPAAHRFGAAHNDLPFGSRIPFDRCVTTQRQALVRSPQRP